MHFLRYVKTLLGCLNACLSRSFAAPGLRNVIFLSALFASKGVADSQKFRLPPLRGQTSLATGFIFIRRLYT